MTRSFIPGQMRTAAPPVYRMPPPRPPLQPKTIQRAVGAGAPAVGGPAPPPVAVVVVAPVARTGSIRFHGAQGRLRIHNAVRWYDIPAGVNIAEGSNVTFETVGMTPQNVQATGTQDQASIDIRDRRLADESGAINLGTATIAFTGGRYNAHHTSATTRARIRAYAGGAVPFRFTAARIWEYAIPWRDNQSLQTGGSILFTFRRATNTITVFHSHRL